jgi:carboxylesterase
MTSERGLDAHPLSVRQGPLGILVLHGFTGSPASMRPLADRFVDAGYSVELPVLPGHGSTPDELARTTFADWLDFALGAYDELARRCERVLVAGLSLGGTLTLALGQRREEIVGLITINPFVEAPAESFITMMNAALKSGVRAIPSIGADIKAGKIRTGYDETPIAALLSLFEGSATVRAGLGQIHQPVLLCTSSVDHVVPTSSGDTVEREVAGPIERVMLENSFHVATLDNDAPELEARALDFAQKVLGG